MWYLTALVLITAVIAVWFFFKKASPDQTLDVNKDGKLDLNDVKAVADVNKDGKVDAADAKAAAVEVVAEVKEVIAEAPKLAEKSKKVAKKAAAPKQEIKQVAAPAPKKTTRKAKY